MSKREFPNAILHLDGDAFFVACEIARDPSLRGKPVVTGAERRIASAVSYEAKALGVVRGMPIYEIRRLYPQVVVLPSSYKTYEIYARRMYDIVRRVSTHVEEYSIDECFADITGLDCERGISFENIMREIQETLYTELGISFSLGLSTTKVLAKVASKYNKPRGITLISTSTRERYIKDLPVGKIWGIGGQTSAHLLSRGVKTVGDFLARGERWVVENCSKPYHEIWLELSGVSVYKVDHHSHKLPKSISSTGTFHHVSEDKTFIFSRLSQHIERVTLRARRLCLVPSDISFFLKTRDFVYFKRNLSLLEKTALPTVLINAVRPEFETLFRKNMPYRATGATLAGLTPAHLANQDLFGRSTRLDEVSKVFTVADLMTEKYGKGAIFIASSLDKEVLSREKPLGVKSGSRGSLAARKHLGLPFLGRVR